MEKRVIVANVNNLIALCHILNKYPDFMVNLEEFMASKNSRGLVESLEEISHGNKSGIGTKKVRNFYNENYDVIDKINKYSSISSFINSSFDYYGNLRENGELNYFYNYFLNNENQMDRINSVLRKISDLGFSKIEFDPKADFTKEEYKINVNFNMNSSIDYVDNAELVLGYQPDVMCYKTIGSDYRITADVSRGPLSDKFSEDGRSIVVNNLLFDYERLPKFIGKPELFDKLLEVRESQMDKCNSIRNSVNLSISINDLLYQFDITSDSIDKLDGVLGKDQMIEQLIEIKKHLEQLKVLSSKYDESIVEENSDITKEKLAREKELFLNRRFYHAVDNAIDID